MARSAAWYADSPAPSCAERPAVTHASMRAGMAATANSSRRACGEWGVCESSQYEARNRSTSKQQQQCKGGGRRCMAGMAATHPNQIPSARIQAGYGQQ